MKGGEFDQRSKPSPPRASKRFTVSSFVDAVFLAAFVALLLLAYRLRGEAQSLRAALQKARVQASDVASSMHIGDSLRNLPVTTAEGRKEALGSSVGAESLVWIMDPDCRACRREAEGVHRVLNADRERRNLVVLTDAPPGKLEPFLSRFGIRPSAVGSVTGLSVQRELRGVHMPQLLYLDKDARVKRITHGGATNPGEAAAQ